MRFIRYPEYKDTGIEWLREIPRHWQVERLKHLFALRREEPLETDENVTAFRDGQVTLRTKRRADGFTNAVLEHGYQRVECGDLVIHAMDAFAGAIGVSDSSGKSTPVYSVCAPRGPAVSAHYFAKLLRHMALSGYLNALSRGIRERSTDFRWSEAGNLLVAVPPTAEQRLIVEFIERESSEISSLIAEQERLIGLLKEKQQGVMARAVTKGLNERAPMKPSGVEWIGDVPAHWTDGTKLKSLSRREPSSFTNGPFGSDLLTSELTDEGVPVVYIRDLNITGYRRTSTSNVSPEKAAQLDKFRVDPGDVLIAKVGNPPGFCCTYPEFEPPGIICQDVIRVKPETSLISANYLCYLLNSAPGVESVNSVCVESTRKRFALADLQSIKFPLPPRTEQDEIAAWLDDALKAYGILQTDAERSIALLQERRMCLIAAAVTGKIDIRALAEVSAAS